MRPVHVRTLAALMLVLGACSETDEPRSSEDSESTADGEDEENVDEDEADDETPAGKDGGTSSNKDAGRSDAKVPSSNDAGDAGTKTPVDASAAADAGRDASSGSGGDAATPAAGDAVPTGEHCAPAAAWDAQAAQFEEEVLKLTNEARAVGHNCDTKGMFGPTTPLKMQPQLRCSSRLHSKYMAETGDFAHDTMTGSTVQARLMAVSYVGRTFGENIAWGQQNAKEVVDGWLDSDGHCSNMMNPMFSEIGVGYAAKAGTGARPRVMPYWTQNFGAPARPR